MSQNTEQTESGTRGSNPLTLSVENRANSANYVGNEPEGCAHAHTVETLQTECRSNKPGTAAGTDGDWPGIHPAMFRAMASAGKPLSDMVAIAAGEYGDPLWIYFIQGVDGGPIKIGRAQNVAVRFEAIQRCSPVRLVVRGVIRGPSAIECALHAYFAAHRLHGEWFAPTPELVALAASAAREAA